MTITSTVCLIAKNESPYLVEWIAYNRFLGFDEIIVYENNSTDDSDEKLKILASHGKVTHRIWRLGAKESPQITAYQDAIKRAKTDWILFIDCDEFLVLRKDKSVSAFLARFHDDQDITAIGVNWRIFGDSGLAINDGRPVMERFTKASERSFPVNAHLKSFMRVNSIGKQIHMHICETSGKIVHPSGNLLEMPSWGLSKEIEFSTAQVNHYYTKTIEEYQIKKRRGQGGAGDNKPELKYWYNDESFKSHNKNDVEDTTILKKYPEIKAEINALNSLLKRI